MEQIVLSFVVTVKIRYHGHSFLLCGQARNWVKQQKQIVVSVWEDVRLWERGMGQTTDLSFFADFRNFERAHADIQHNQTLLLTLNLPAAIRVPWCWWITQSHGAGCPVEFVSEDWVWKSWQIQQCFTLGSETAGKGSWGLKQVWAAGALFAALIF